MLLASSQVLGSDAGIKLETEKPIHTPVDTPPIETVRACPAGEQCTVHWHKVRMESQPIALFKSVINEVIE